MKFINIKLTAIFFSLLITFTSCNKDDDGFEERIENTATENNETQKPDNPKSSEGITLYKVNGEDIEKIKDYKVSGKDLEYQKDTKKHQEIWTLTKKIIPLSYRNRINEFVIYNGEKDESAGYVIPTSDDLSTWKMGIAIDYAYEDGFNANGELAYTIIHEFGHVLTLDKTQVDSSINENACTNFFTDEGCAKQTSFINQSYQKFWKDIIGEFNEAGDNQTKQEAFYNKYKSRFVTKYASSNPGEDSAEVFAVFVTKKDKPTTNTIADQKINLMYTFPEFVDLRNHIRSNIGNSSKSGAKDRSNENFLPEAGSWRQANTIGKSSKLHCAHKH